MHRFSAAIPILMGCLTVGAAAEEEPVVLTAFELKDGRKLDAWRFSSLGSADTRSYLITTLDGQKSIYLEKEIVGRQERAVAFESLPEAARQEIQKARAVNAALKADMAARAKTEEKAAAIRRKEQDARGAAKRAEDELVLARAVLQHAEEIVKAAPIEAARLDAQYDAAKTELGALGPSSYIGGFVRTGVEPRRADQLRDIMMQTAEDKARLEQSKKEAQDVVTRVQETIKQLDARADEAAKNFAAARTEIQNIFAKEREAALERAKAAAAQAGDAKAKAAPEPPVVTQVTLRDGTVIQATAILEDPDGRAAIKDIKGNVRFVQVGEIVKREPDVTTK